MSGHAWCQPGRDPIRRFVYSADGGSVDTVVIDGKVVMKNRELTTIDEARLKHDVLSAGKAWMGRANVPVTTPWPVA